MAEDVRKERLSTKRYRPESPNDTAGPGQKRRSATADKMVDIRADTLQAALRIIRTFSRSELQDLALFVEQVIKMKEKHGAAGDEGSVTPPTKQCTSNIPDRDQDFVAFFLEGETPQARPSLQGGDGEDNDDESEPESEGDTRVPRIAAASAEVSTRLPSIGTDAAVASAESSTAAKAAKMDLVLKQLTGMTMFALFGKLPDEQITNLYELISIFTEDSKKPLWRFLLLMFQSAGKTPFVPSMVLTYAHLEQNPGVFRHAADFIQLLMREDLQTNILRTLLTLLQRFTNLSNEQYEQLAVMVPEGFFSALLHAYFFSFA